MVVTEEVYAAMLRLAHIVIAMTLAWGAAGAVAQELPAAANGRVASFSGTALSRIAASAAVRRGVRTAESVRASARALVQSGVLKTQLRGRAYDWDAGPHASLPRVVLRRVLAAGQSSPSEADYLAELRASQNAVDAKGILSRADGLVAQLSSAGLLPGSESFVAVHQGGGALGLEDAATGRRELLVTERRVVYRRHAGGIPIVGRSGEFEIVFDVQGDALEIELPSDEYSASSSAGASSGRSTLRTLDGSAALAQAMRAAGFDRVPTAANAVVAKGGASFEVRDLQCGFMESESGTTLQRGCVVVYASKKAAVQELLPVD